MTYNPRYFSSGQVTTPQITESAVTSEKIADETIESRDIKNKAIQTEDIADKAVTLAKLGDDVPAVGIPDNSISAAKLADNAVERRHLATGAVDTDELANASVTTEKLRDAGVTNAKIATNTITQGKIANNAIGTGEIQNGAVTQDKLAPGVGGGDTMTFLPTSVEALYLTDIAADIPYTPFDLSAYVPEGAKGVIIQIGIFNQAFTSGRAFFRVRTNETQRDALGLGMMVGANSQVANQGMVPLTSARTVEYALESVGGPWSATLTLYITVVGYIV